VKNQNILKVISQIGPFIGSQYPQGKADQGPDVNDLVAAAVMFTELMNLGMTVMAAGNAVIRAGGLDLVILKLAEFQTILFKTRLQETAAAAAAIVVGTVGMHFNEIFFPHNRFDHESQVFSNGVPESFTHDLTGILHRKFDFQILVPVGVDFQPAFPDPLGIIFVDVLDDKVMLDLEFFQSCQD
jgi:hypothetical protein